MASTIDRRMHPRYQVRQGCEMNGASDRRRYPRYQLGESAIAVLSNKLGNIQDISIGGISFVYMSCDDSRQGGDAVDILDGQNDFFMKEIPCRMVLEKIHINEVSFSMLRMVHCTLEFGALTQSQQDELATYIRMHSLGRYSPDNRASADSALRPIAKSGTSYRCQEIGLWWDSVTAINLALFHRCFG